MLTSVFSIALMLLPGSVGAGTAAGTDDTGIYLVTGATGSTGSIIYKSLQAAGYSTRGLVTNITKARDILGCDACDASEGIYVADVTNASSLTAAMDGVSFVADAVGVSGSTTDEVAEAVEWQGVENQISVLANGAVSQGRPLSSLQYAMISSRGTTDPVSSA